MMPAGPFASETPFERSVRAIEPLLPPVATGAVVDVDLLLAHLLVDGPLLDLDVLLHPHPLLRDRALLGDDFLLVEDDLVLLLGDRRALRRAVDVGVRDRLALDADL